MTVRVVTVCDFEYLVVGTDERSEVIYITDSPSVVGVSARPQSVIFRIFQICPAQVLPWRTALRYSDMRSCSLILRDVVPLLACAARCDLGCYDVVIRRWIVRWQEHYLGATVVNSRTIITTCRVDGRDEVRASLGRVNYLEVPFIFRQPLVRLRHKGIGNGIPLRLRLYRHVRYRSLYRGIGNVKVLYLATLGKQHLGSHEVLIWHLHPWLVCRTGVNARCGCTCRRLFARMGVTAQIHLLRVLRIDDNALVCFVGLARHILYTAVPNCRTSKRFACLAIVTLLSLAVGFVELPVGRFLALFQLEHRDVDFRLRPDVEVHSLVRIRQVRSSEERNGVSLVFGGLFQLMRVRPVAHRCDIFITENNISTFVLASLVPITCHVASYIRNHLALDLGEHTERVPCGRLQLANELLRQYFYRCCY